MRRIFLKIPFIEYVVTFRRCIYKNTRQKYLEDKEKFNHWAEEVKTFTDKKVAYKNGYKGRVLVVSHNNIMPIKLESFFLKAFELIGYDPYVLMREINYFAIKAYKIQGIKDVNIMGKYAPISMKQEAINLMDSITNMEELLNLSWKGVKVGRSAAVSLIRSRRCTKLALDDNNDRKQIIDRLSDALCFTEEALKTIDLLKPKVAIFCEIGITPYGEYFEACILNNIPCYVYKMSHKNNALTFKMYNQNNVGVHPFSLSKKSWDYMKNIKWKKYYSDEIYNEILNCYKNEDWYGGTQHNKIQFKDTELKSILGFDNNKKLAIVFPHIFWDNSLTYGINLFESYEDWFVEVIKVACKNANLNWIVKIHPAHVFQDKREGYFGLCEEEEVINQYIGKLPSHVKIMPSNSNISTFSLYQVMDYCLTVRGTAGIEAAMIGKRVLTAGTGRYDRMGFTIDFETKEDYLECISRLQEIEMPNEKEIELANKFAYGLYKSRVLELEQFRCEYLKDEQASLNVFWKITAEEDISKFKDMASIVNWINSGDEDFFEFR